MSELLQQLHECECFCIEVGFRDAEVQQPPAGVHEQLLSGKRVMVSAPA